MEKKDFKDIFASQESQKKLNSLLAAGNENILLKGLHGSSKAYALANAVQEYDRAVHILLMDNIEQAKFFTSDLYGVLHKGAEMVYYFPSSSNLSSRITTVTDNSRKVQRSAALSAVNDFNNGVSGEKFLILVTYPGALNEKIVNNRALSNLLLKISVNDSLTHEFIKETLVSYNFERVDFVSEPGQYAVRGGIIDLFSFSNDKPYRIDFFGNSIESIKEFDINTQRSVAELQSIEIFPNIYENGELDETEKLSLFEYIKGKKVLWINDYDAILSEETEKSIEYAGKCKKIFFSESGILKGKVDIVEFKTSPQPSFNKNFDILLANINESIEKGYTIYISSDNPRQIERLRSIFAHKEGDDFTAVPTFEVINKSIHEGFIDSALKVCLYTDHQIFDRYHRVRIKREVQPSERLTIEEINAFRIGDYVVHIDHGVGIFGGLVKTNINGKVQEAIKLVYKDDDVIFVSIHGIHRISKYKSKDSVPPKIYKLGTGAWDKLKNTTKSKVKDIARDLIKLYASRRDAKGFAFSQDSYLQHELEASFMYEDTPDQTRATKAVKEDMEKPYPMDRLVCGDVGFGKTEVAIRAAFKAVADSKQVALLVPTTILALQHYQTFSARLKDFPCTIEYVSRLKSPKQIKEITGKLEDGSIDIIIGTHKLLNKEFKFKDLGLLIIDEEQKFGVAAKERLRQMKLTVDTLTLTATPIPRTLQFSLLGARDLSIINTPPPNRLPVHTEIIDFNEEIIRDAITFEVERGGQVFFVHNKIEDILSIESIIRRICPGVKTCIGHGQMDPKELERRMLDFMAGDYDILIATTIMENGIDVPNANTIIINQAQNFGLSDLHQLRGRVGRSNVKAFCYLIVPPMVSISDDARRRLRAIEAFSDLGSGFNIAMQDLDIRGAGNLLGGEQSGFIADMGFETYQRILSEAFAEIQQETKAETGDDTQVGEHGNDETARNFISDCVIDTDLELLIPDTYIPQIAEKIRLYKKLDGMSEESDLAKFVEDLTDRFGELPEQVRQLINVVRVRREAVSLGFERIVVKNGILLAYFISDQHSAYYKSSLFAGIMNYINGVGKRFRMKEQNNKLLLRVEGIEDMGTVYNLLRQIRESLQNMAVNRN